MCIVHRVMDGSWVWDQKPVASSGWTLHSSMPTGMRMSMESNLPYFLTSSAPRKVPVDSRGNAESGFLPVSFLHCGIKAIYTTIGSEWSACLLVLGAWYEGKDGIKGYQSFARNLMTPVAGELYCSHFSWQRKQGKKQFNLHFPSPLASIPAAKHAMAGCLHQVANLQNIQLISPWL